MLHLEEESTSMSVSEWILPLKVDDNATWIDYHSCSIDNTKIEMKKERERDWELGFVDERPTFATFDRIKVIKHTHIETNFKHF